MKRNHTIYFNILMMACVITTLLAFPSGVKAVPSISNVKRNLNQSNQGNVEQQTTTVTPTYPPYPNPTIILSPAPTIIITPTSEPPDGFERPVIVVNTYSLDQDTISPGNSFKLFITLYNAGQQYATNVVAIFSSGDLIPRDTGGVVEFCGFNQHVCFIHQSSWHNIH
jgi:hypothetical protein